MHRGQSLLDSHGITCQLQVQHLKLQLTTTEKALTQKTQSKKFKLKLKSKWNRNKKWEKEIEPKSQSDQEHLISNGITSHIRIHIVRQEVAQLMKEFDSGNSEKPSCSKRSDSKRVLYNCPICPRHVELSVGFLRNHMAAKHRAENLLKCLTPKCEFSTWVPHFLKNHLSRVHQQLPFHCTVCPKKFKTSSYLQVHLLSHTAAAEAKKQICPRPNCEYATHHAGNLTTHLQSHSLEPKYKCQQCGFRTKYKTSIALHVEAIHEVKKKYKPFKCPSGQCNFAAQSLNKLNVHSRVHSDHRPFKCHLCKFATIYAESLRKHLMVHSGLKPFECLLCGKKIRIFQNLQDHLRRHLREKPFKCLKSNCNFVAATRSEIKVHAYYHH